MMVLSQVVASGHNWATAQWDVILLNYEVRDLQYYLASDWRRSKFYYIESPSNYCMALEDSNLHAVAMSCVVDEYLNSTED